MKMIKPTKVLCKRIFQISKPFWWDDEGSISPPDHPKRHDYDSRDLVEGEWYDVVENENDVWDTKKDKYTFTILNHQGKKSLHYMYTDEQRANFPDHCDAFGPRDYAKWFYTPEELKELEAGTYKMSFKEKHAISVFVGNYHWVKPKDGDWIIALCSGKHPAPGKHWWTLMGSDVDKCDFDFEEIGHQVDSMKTQQENKDKLKDHSELNDTIFPMIDSWKAQGTEDEKWRAPLEYHKPFVEKAVRDFFNKSWDRISDSDLFFGSNQKEIKL